MDWDGKSDGSTSSQISDSEDAKSKVKGKVSPFVRKRRGYDAFEFFLNDYRRYRGGKPGDSAVDLRRKAFRAWHRLAPELKLQYLINTRIQISRERKLRALALKNKSKLNAMDRTTRCSDTKTKCKVKVVDTSPRSTRHKMVARRPTPWPFLQKKIPIQRRTPCCRGKSNPT
ncbi:uncharacterized protein LOC108093810 [Drosophila ficusphila]|uniref:uncharacterized protein LOC108093810 n=1 Tax=Drosophila ficusphila TaxID=30025 RepID=UPI001C896E65|nr:uncharacterized protein LOC108093810 [Drosophila ficusphila]